MVISIKIKQFNWYILIKFIYFSVKLDSYFLGFVYLASISILLMQHNYFIFQTSDSIKQFPL